MKFKYYEHAHAKIQQGILKWYNMECNLVKCEWENLMT